MDTVTVSHINYILGVFAKTLYEEWVWYPNNVCDETFVDGDTGRLIKDVPWTDTGSRLWDLSRPQARKLSSLLRNRDECPFFYNGRFWHVDLANFGNLDAVTDYFLDNPIGQIEWDQA